MPLERLERGRKYTKRHYLRALGELTTEERRELDQAREQAELLETIQAKLMGAAGMAICVLVRNDLPVDPGNPLYSDEWMRANEARTPAWYAVKILRTVLEVNRRRDAGDVDGAMAGCIMLGWYAAEAWQVAHVVDRQRRAGASPKEKVNEKHVRWRRQAVEFWQRHPSWSASSVADKIDRGVPERNVNTIRKRIGDLKPKRPQK